MLTSTHSSRSSGVLKTKKKTRSSYILRQKDFDTNANTHPVLYPVYGKKQYPET